MLGAIRAPGGHARPLASSSGLSIPTPTVAVAGCQVPLRRPALKERTVWAEL